MVMTDTVQLVNIIIGIFISVTAFIGLGWKAWTSLTAIVNGLGDRVKKLEHDEVVNDERMHILRRDSELFVQESKSVRDRISSAEVRIDALREELRDDRLAIMSQLHASEKHASERDATLRVELSKLKERLNINEMIRTVVREQKNA